MFMDVCFYPRELQTFEISFHEFLYTNDHVIKGQRDTQGRRLLLKLYESKKRPEFKFMVLSRNDNS